MDGGAPDTGCHWEAGGKQRPRTRGDVIKVIYTTQLYIDIRDAVILTLLLGLRLFCFEDITNESQDSYRDEHEEIFNQETLSTQYISLQYITMQHNTFIKSKSNSVPCAVVQYHRPSARGH